MSQSLIVALHLGTLMAVLLYFYRDWLHIADAAYRRLRFGTRSHLADVLLPGLVIGTIPAAICGTLWAEQIEAWFYSPLSVSVPLAGIGVLLWYIDKRQPNTRTQNDLSLKDAFLIGIGQALALIPGVSRSGITILTGRVLKFNSTDAARFSFLLGTPALAGAAMLKSSDIAAGIADPVFYTGFLSSLVVGMLSIGFLLAFLRRFGFAVFAAYRVGLALAIWIAVIEKG